ncbi:MAG: hypothetical protein ABW223_01400, partial [Rariglobus sp.]
MHLFLRHFSFVRLSSAVLFTLILFTEVQADVFTLTDKQGRSLKAEVLSVSNDQVKIKRNDGQTFNLPLATLAPEDQEKL